MKHLQLYENFSASKEIVFDWMPYDKQTENPIQSQIPQTLPVNELQSYISSAPSEVEKAGLFIAHVPTEDQGFERYIVTSFNPLKFNVTKWDDKYEKQTEFDNVDPSEINLGDLSKGASIISRFGGFEE